MIIEFFKVLVTCENDNAREFGEGQMVFIYLKDGREYHVYIDELQRDYMIIQDTETYHKFTVKYDEIKKIL